jgi:REP element-mobilizing transposase RayT
MSHTYACLIFHLVWSTKNRLPLITPELQPRLYHYIGGIVRDMNGISISIGGMPDHIHLLVGLKPTHKPATIVQNIKRGSSQWINDELLNKRSFHWQEGYGIFTVAYANKKKTQRYIENQEQHHRKRTFEDEWMLILERHGIDYDVKYAFG